MLKKNVKIGHYTIPLHVLNTVIVGSGAAGFNAADRLYCEGCENIAIVTENVNWGTSRNTGSDKQTYYRLTLAGDAKDSVYAMAETLYSGECTDGDHAICEAALSAEGFLRLAGLGVPFPQDRYGQYVGYKTDHDPMQRASSVGPYTSKIMTEALEKAVTQKNIPVFDKMQVIRILTKENKIWGLLCLNLESPGEADTGFVIFRCTNVIYATGGQAGIYKDNIFPQSQHGASGLAIEAGASGKNLTEWQYGMGSLNPLWNVSGSYMQSLPRFISRNQDGRDEREFLLDYFETTEEMHSRIFLKGYQWPFDARKATTGSSLIDILVHAERMKGRRVFLDYRCNSQNKPIDFSALSDEARSYLEKLDACFGTPFQRISHMNAPAVSFYRDHGVDLETEVLEIAVCAQHSNGGISVDHWWQSSIQGLFPVGEAAGTHGVYRPGGSALNAGQVGSARAARYIAVNRSALPEDASVPDEISLAVEEMLSISDDVLSGASTALEITNELRNSMSLYAGCFRDDQMIDALLKRTSEVARDFKKIVKIKAKDDLREVFCLRESLYYQMALLNAMKDYRAKGGKSRGSAIYVDQTGQKPHEALPGSFRYCPANGELADKIQEVHFKDNSYTCSWRSVRPIPGEPLFFETQWRTFRENKNAY